MPAPLQPVDQPGPTPVVTPTLTSKTLIGAVVTFAAWFPGWISTSGFLGSAHLDKRVVSGLNLLAVACGIITALVTRDASKLAVLALQQQSKAQVQEVTQLVADHIDPDIPTTLASSRETASSLREVVKDPPAPPSGG